MGNLMAPHRSDASIWLVAATSVEADVMDDWQAQQQQDEQDLQERILSALKRAEAQPLTREETMLLAWQCGLATEFYMETRND